MSNLNSFSKKESALKRFWNLLFIIPVLFGIVVGFGLSFSYAKVEQTKAVGGNTAVAAEQGTLLSATDSAAFWNYKEDITKVVFQNELKPMESNLSWDVSVENNASVMAYLMVNTKDETKYTLYLQGNGVINANPDSSNLFSGFINLQTIEALEYFNTSQITTMSKMFYNCESLTRLDLRSFKTENVTDMSYMFSGCSSLTNLDVSGFDISNVTNMIAMFYQCPSLTMLNLNNFNFDHVTSLSTDDGKDGFLADATNITTTINIKSNSIIECKNAFSNAATVPESQITINYTGEAEELVSNLIHTKSPESNVMLGFCLGHCQLKLYTIKFYDQDGKVTSSFMSYSHENIEVPVASGYTVTSFKLNGEEMKGNKFTMPEQDVDITDIQIAE